MGAFGIRNIPDLRSWELYSRWSNLAPSTQAGSRLSHYERPFQKPMRLVGMMISNPTMEHCNRIRKARGRYSKRSR
jgi:hypothetical protein